MGGTFSQDRAPRSPSGAAGIGTRNFGVAGHLSGQPRRDNGDANEARNLSRKRRRPRRVVIPVDGDTTSDEGDSESVDFSSTEDESSSSAAAVASSSPSARAPHTKRLKLDSTAQYIYDKLFIQGEGSDVTIRCLGREWKLHKLYLSQSNYFECMFGGRWLESDLNTINIDIPDSFVTESALNIAFGSLYCGEVNIPTGEVVAVLSAASLFQLDGMVELCIKIMHQNINLSTVGLYYNAAQLYGHPKLARKCAKWLQRVLMFTQSLDLLQSISIDLMVTIIQSTSNFFVNQVEMDIYTLLKKWVFLRLNPSWSGQRRELLDAKDTFFQTQCSGRVSFLETDMGIPFVPAFKGLRLQYISADRASLLKVEQDNIIPKQWLRDICWIQWKTMLKSENASVTGNAANTNNSQPASNINSTETAQNTALVSQQLLIQSSNAVLVQNSSPTRGSNSGGDQPGLNSGSNARRCNPPTVAPSVFNKYSMRCGRILDIPNNDYCWRWTGFNYGVDLLMLFSNNKLMIKRNVNTHPTTQSLSMQEKREIMLRVSALSFDENYNAVYFKTSGIVCKELGKDEELLIMDIDRYAICPIYLSFNVLTTVPDVALYQQICRPVTSNSGSVNNPPAVVGSANEESANNVETDLNSSVVSPSSASNIPEIESSGP
ncbi:germ cell-less protein-like 1 [Symsagittifera roscoffensis]|uniref:germ cell-less protein-like 1 n=1 Tax=Symsagittifera roscoffensis TaxID=84072 RepID=UPI00307B9F35